MKSIIKYWKNYVKRMPGRKADGQLYCPAYSGSYSAVKASVASRRRWLPSSMSATLITRFSPAAIARMTMSLSFSLWCE